MKMKIFKPVLIALASTICLAGGAIAESETEAVCVASLDSEGAIPPGVTREQMEEGCACMAEKASGNETVEADILKVAELSPAERESEMSDALREIVAACFPIPS